MTYILAIDTETTGLPPRGMSLADPAYPYPVELAAVLLEAAAPHRELALVSLIVAPDGWEIPAEAVAVHGLDAAAAARAGVPLRVAVAALTNLARRADLLVGHNVDFDLGVLRSAVIRFGGDPAVLAGPRACIAEMGAPRVNLPPTPRMIEAGITRPKTSRLGELYEHLFGETLTGAHGALADARAAARCYFAMVEE